MRFKYIVSSFLILFWSCGGSDVDVVAPEMEIVEYIPMPIIDTVCGEEEPSVFQITGGEVLTFDIVFTDDVALSQFKVDIHNNFDCHGHGGGSAPNIAVPSVNNVTTDWTVLDIGNLSGQSEQVRNTLEVPSNVTAGNYHFHIQAVDEAGNDSPFSNFNSIKVTNPTDSEQPLITISEPSTSTLNLRRGDIFTLMGNVSDNRSLSDGGNGVVYLAYTDLSSMNTFTTSEAIAFDETVGNSYDFEFNYQIPNTLVDGKYRFSVGANDGVRNVADFVFFEVEVTD